MRRKLIASICLGIAVGFAVWLSWLTCTSLFAIYNVQKFNVLQPLIKGFLLMALTSAVLCSKQSFLLNNLVHFKKKFLYGLFFGGLIGILYFSVNIFLFSYVQGQSVLMSSLFFMQKWLLTSFFIGLVFIISNSNTAAFSKIVLICIIISLILYCANFLLHFFNLYMIKDGVLLLMFEVSLFILMWFFIDQGKKNWIRVLNGKLTGEEFDLVEPYLHIGSQIIDDIALTDYSEVNPVHVTLVRYENNYLATNNVPSQKTYLNFRSIDEQLHQNGDILKIGSTLLQYCSK